MKKIKRKSKGHSNKKSKSIANKLLMVVITLVVITLVVITLVVITFMLTGFIINNKVSTMVTDLVRNDMVSQSQNISANIGNFFTEKADIVKIMANTDSITNYIKGTEGLASRSEVKQTPSYPSILRTLQNMKKSDKDLGLVYVALEDNNNFISEDPAWEVPTEWDIMQRAWYTDAVAKKDIHFTVPYIDNVTNKLVISAVTPIFENGKSIGASAIDVSIDRLSTMMSQYKIGEGSYAILIDNTGTVVYHPDEKLILESNMTQIDGELGEIGQAMVRGESGVTKYVHDGEKKYIAYMPIEINGWSVAMTIPETYVLDKVNAIRKIILLLYGLSCVGLAISILLLTKKILKDVPVILEGLTAVSNGDLSVKLNIQSNDEIGEISSKFNIMVENMKKLVSSAKTIAGEVASASNYLEKSSKETNMSVEEVARAVDEIARGASEQAADAEKGAELTIGLDHKFNQLSENSKDMSNATKEVMDANVKGVQLVNELKEKTEINNDATKRVEGAIHALAIKSKDIGSILETITSIAEQTNLLALNASIEAARAGEHGRGFAVVADEIRKLAEGSARAADEINKIIVDIQKESSNTVDIMKEVSERSLEQHNAVMEANHSFEDIYKAIENIAQKIEDITEFVNDISKDKDNIVYTIGNISSVSEETAAATEEVSASMEQQSAAVEEVASAAEKLNKLAEKLNVEMNYFKM
ncbi:methyl-accepting chemotaxis protein [Crassaminicella profunda]|uniref:methyl-accepting chemotaxis protein n=1 Tax=Crassaminicella profunda TaxID=1286698 RepID=UPI001CA605CB|nr:methyl-accepting chemotaxis protein [Crassaminicella profunda]QZY54517.1 methyl-accepting chemotaxis protein [Crassaminicella profunda]